jgi:glucuronate isomerase
MASDQRFRSITEIWLNGDHYRWRAMRALGVPERLITGDASDWEKFEAWARSVPSTLGNPLYHWTAMELKRPFAIDEPLTAGNRNNPPEQSFPLNQRPGSQVSAIQPEKIKGVEHGRPKS